MREPNTKNLILISKVDQGRHKVFIWGFNKGKSAKNKQFSKLAHNSPDIDINIRHEVSNPPILGIVGDKKWSPFLDSGIRSFKVKINDNISPTFCTLTFVLLFIFRNTPSDFSSVKGVQTFSQKPPVAK